MRPLICGRRQLASLVPDFAGADEAPVDSLDFVGVAVDDESLSAVPAPVAAPSPLPSELAPAADFFAAPVFPRLSVR